MFSLITNDCFSGYFIDNVETKTQLNRKYGDKNESFTFVRVEQNIKEPDVE